MEVHVNSIKTNVEKNNIILIYFLFFQEFKSYHLYQLLNTVYIHLIIVNQSIKNKN